MQKSHFHDIPARARKIALADVATQTITPSYYRTSKHNTDQLRRTRRNGHRVACIFFLTMLVTFAVIMLLTWVIVPWWTNNISNQWQYGTGRVSYAQFHLNGKVCDVLGIGYKGSIQIVIMDSQDAKARPQVYTLPDYFADGKTHVVTAQAQDINHDGLTDIVLTVDDGSFVVMPVLYATQTGYQWTTPR